MRVTRPSMIQLALEPSVVKRGLRYALFVGALLIGINHGDALLGGDIGGGRVAKMVLTVLVPYLVSTFSSVSAMREAGDR